jgi:hypothetical protein
MSSSLCLRLSGFLSRGKKVELKQLAYQRTSLASLLTMQTVLQALAYSCSVNTHECRKLQQSEGETAKLRLQLKDVHAAHSTPREQAANKLSPGLDESSPARSAPTMQAAGANKRMYGDGSAGGLRAAIQTQHRTQTELHDPGDDLDLEFREGAVHWLLMQVCCVQVKILKVSCISLRSTLHHMSLVLSPHDSVCLCCPEKFTAPHVNVIMHVMLIKASVDSVHASRHFM